VRDGAALPCHDLRRGGFCHVSSQQLGRCHVIGLATPTCMARQYSLAAPCMEARPKVLVLKKFSNGGKFKNSFKKVLKIKKILSV
jgi:hypothetical protein